MYYIMERFSIADRQNQILRERIALGLGFGGCEMCPTCQGMGINGGYHYKRAGMLDENYGYGMLDENYGYGDMSDEEGGLTGGRRRKHKVHRKKKKSGSQMKAVAYAKRHHVSMPEAWRAIQ